MLFRSWRYRLSGVRYLFDHHDVCPELFEAKFDKKGLLVMEKDQKVSLERYPRYRGKVRLITDFDQGLKFMEIFNPYAPDEDNLSERDVQSRYQRSFDQLQLALCDGMVAIVEAAKAAYRAR